MQLLNAGDKGWGVFAGEDIQPDTLVCIYVGEVVDADEAARRRTIYSLKVGVRILGVDHVEKEGHPQRTFYPSAPGARLLHIRPPQCFPELVHDEPEQFCHIYTVDAATHAPQSI